MNAPDTTDHALATAAAVPRAIEVGISIVETNRLAEPERNSFKPIYQMHQWFARRASCVFRAILLGALKPAVHPWRDRTHSIAPAVRQRPAAP